MVVLNFENFAKLVWINLDQIEKCMKEIKKTEMEKEAKEIKIEKGPRGNDLAQHRIQPIAQLIKPEPVLPLSLPLADRWDPPVSIITSTVSSLPSLETEARRSNSPLIPRE
jgi:hypothetical protein